MGTPAAEFHVDVELVVALLRDQHPDLADLPLRVVASGWDNVVVRAGDALAVRLPRRAAAATLVEHEQRWLPTIAALVGDAAPVPEPGRPAGEQAQGVRVAQDLAAVVTRLHVPAPADAPANPVRAVPLATRSEAVTTRLATDDVPRAVELATLWRTAAGAPTHVGPPVWVHGDLHPFNLLVEPTPLGDRRLSAVVDFGDLTAGDPAVDLATRWLTLDDAGGRTFASLVDADPAT
ncbi:phosphotransferase [Curtobacterium sp. BRD11]|uniref:phosphotransferase n=1 Tax=Curtobacterium sp. BRD11 TaxID=2962581 RepID=UPI002881F375|nr:phosphotransferase [Curtobacterium sp. BRD11]MDT0209983.1 phosphotransferase [Curtobacterium sp. BRD11]